jgi:hypothetical protein
MFVPVVENYKPMKYLFTLIISCLFYFNSIAQVNIDSAWIEGTQWVETFMFNSGQGVGSHTGLSYTVKRDSVINSQTYRLIECKYMGGYTGVTGQPNAPWVPSNPNYPARIIGAVRVDTAEVYFIRLDDMVMQGYGGNFNSEFQVGVEKLIYDFDLQLGDTVHWKPDTNNIVLKIDSVTLSNGAYARRYMFREQPASFEDYWIEGIGSSLSVLGQSKYGRPQAGIQTTRTMCYVNPQYHYSFDGSLTKGCFYIPPTAINEVEAEVSTLSIVNPMMNDILELSTNTELSSLLIYDVSGKVHYQHSKPMHTGNHKLYVPLEQGLYFIVVQCANGAIEKRKIVKL